MKEIRIRPQITDNDLNTLVKRTHKWFTKKGKRVTPSDKRVKVVVFFRGRQHQFMDELGPDTINRFLALLKTYKVINSIVKQGRRFVIVVDPA